MRIFGFDLLSLAVILAAHVIIVGTFAQGQKEAIK